MFCNYDWGYEIGRWIDRKWILAFPCKWSHRLNALVFPGRGAKKYQKKISESLLQLFPSLVRSPALVIRAALQQLLSSLSPPPPSLFATKIEGQHRRQTSFLLFLRPQNVFQGRMENHETEYGGIFLLPLSSIVFACRDGNQMQIPFSTASSSADMASLVPSLRAGKEICAIFFSHAAYITPAAVLLLYGRAQGALFRKERSAFFCCTVREPMRAWRVPYCYSENTAAAALK